MNRRLPPFLLGIAALVPLAADAAAPAKSNPLQAGLDRIAAATAAKALPSPEALRRAHPGAQFGTSGSGATMVAVEIAARPGATGLARRLAALGADGVEVDGRMLSARVPVTSLGALGADADVVFARPVRAKAWRGTVTSQGDFVLRAPLARPPATAGGPTGAGVTVGVMSDSFNCGGGASGDVANDEYNPVQVLKEEPDCFSGTDEGRAMVQIVADVAPDANLMYRTAFVNERDFARGIRQLADAGANVIVDDIGYFTSPYYHDGLIAQAVDEVAAKGVAYFSAAANSGRMSYESAFRPTEAPAVGAGGAGISHDFAPKAGETQIYQGIRVLSGQSITIALQWDDAFFTSSNGATTAKGDVDLYLYNTAKTKIVAQSADNNLEGDAIEILDFTNNGAAATFYLRIEYYGGRQPTRVKYIDFGDGDRLQVDYATNSSTLTGQPNAKGAFAVGAAAYDRTPECGVVPAEIESYSSAGGTRILLKADGSAQAPELREKPDATGPDGANTSFFGSDIPNPGDPAGCRDKDSFPNFFGTSAAAPHVAGVAALMREKKPTATPAQVYAALRSTASDMGPAGFDFDSGYGFVRADDAIQKIANAKPVVTLNKAQQAVEEGLTGQVSLVLNTASDAPVSVTLALSGRASPDVDYTAPSLTVTIPAGTLSKKITIPTIEDPDVEPDEVAAITLVSATKAEVGTQNVYRLTIVNDDTN